MSVLHPPDLIAESLAAYDPAALFKPGPDYARRPLPEAFIDIEGTLKQLFKKHSGVQQFDATAFYSKRRANLIPEEEEALAVFNQAAFTAAESLGGLVVYYQGHILEADNSNEHNPDLELDFNPDCLSFCIWETRRQALAGAGVAAHKQAVARTPTWYENFALKKYEINTVQGNLTWQEFKRK